MKPFATTRWSLILAARDGPAAEAREALEALFTAYWYPVYAFIRRQGHGAEEAKDLTQGYFTCFLEKEFLKSVRPELGSFRSFLMVSLRHFLSNERDRARALKRGGGRPVLPLDGDSGEEAYRLEPVEELTPERLFERRWALTVIDRALDRLCAQYAEQGRADLFESLSPYLTAAEATERYAELAPVLGMSEGAIRVAVHRLRRRFGQSLRAEVSRTVVGPEDVDAELRHLLRAVRP